VLPHIRVALEALAARCTHESITHSQGWAVDWWELEPSDVDLAVELYPNLLLGGRTVGVQGLLAAKGIDLDALLFSPKGKDDITRSDLTEMVAAASIVGRDGWTSEDLHMPNVPKMARKKSDSGIDVMGVLLDSGNEGALESGEKLILVSVKHSIQTSTEQLRSKLVKSVTDDLSRPYLACQLRVLSGDLIREGTSAVQASRAYLFLDFVDDPDMVDVLAVGVVNTEAVEDLRKRLGRLPPVDVPTRFRAVSFPGLSEVAGRCP